MTDATRWTGGRVQTGARTAEALLVEDGRVAAVGSEAEVRRASPTGVEHRALAGRLLLPGLVDAHLHVAELTRNRNGLPLGELRSAEELERRLSAWADEHPTGPLVGRGWDAERFTGRETVDRRGLDRVVPDRPVVLFHVSGHAAVANSAALADAERIGGPPEATLLGHASDGAPNGLVYEEGLRWLRPAVEAALEVSPDAVADTLRDCAALGLTLVGTMNTHEGEARTLATLDREGQLPIGVRAYLNLDLDFDAVPPPAERPDRRFRVIGVKAFADGAFGPRTAWLDAPYADAPEESGRAVGSDADVADRLSAAAGRGLALAVHAIGDRGLARALAFLAPWAGASDRPPDRVEHASLTPPHLWPLLEGVRPTLAVQPGFILSDHWLDRRLGAARARWAYAFRSLLDRGLPLAGSSDAPFDPVDPWRGIRAAVERADEIGRSANRDPAEALPVAEAVRLYTTSAAAALGEPTRGRLVAGGPADLVVLDAPSLETAVRSRAPPVEETWVGGRPVYVRASPAPGTTV